MARFTVEITVMAIPVLVMLSSSGKARSVSTLLRLKPSIASGIMRQFVAQVSKPPRITNAPSVAKVWFLSLSESKEGK
jgi:hypothetical protein